MSPSVRKIVETSIYVADLERSESFYTSVLGLETVARQEGRHVFMKAGRSMLLIFNPDGLKREREMLGEQAIPQVYEGGRTHIAFGVAIGEMDDWRRMLEERKVKIEHEMLWGTGNTSIYFRDPDQNVIELITPGSWPVEE